ncbi:MAG: biotin/lipoyl-binding protein, partial [Verrucomicrobiota bacterium]
MKETVIQFWNNKKWRWATLSVMGLILLAVLLKPIVAPAQEAELGTVVRGDAIAAVYGTITVEPETEVLVKSRTSGVVREINVEQNDVVRAGDAMAKIADEELVTTLQEMKVELESAKQRLKIGPASANELKSRQLELERIAPLVREGIIAP